MAGVCLLTYIGSGAATYPIRAPTPTSYHYGDLDGDSAITTMVSAKKVNFAVIIASNPIIKTTTC